VESIVESVYLEQLVMQYQNLVFSLCYRMTGDYFAAQDLTQDTFLSAYRNIGDFDRKHEKAWLCRIASNKCIDYLKSAGRRVVASEEEELDRNPSVRGDPEKHAVEEEVRATLLARCQSLKPPYDEVARLYFYEECRPEEIARRVGRNLKTVQTQIYRARDRLRELYRTERD